MTTKPSPKNEAEIQAEITKLTSMQPLVRPISVFGDDNRAAIGAQIEALTKRLTLEQVTQRWCDAGSDDAEAMEGHVLDAHDWYMGLSDEPAPSEGWACLMPDAVLERPTQLETSRAHIN